MSMTASPGLGQFPPDAADRGARALALRILSQHPNVGRVCRDTVTGVHRRSRLTVTVFIRYQIDPFKPTPLRICEALADVIPQNGGDLLGYWMRMKAPQHRLRADFVRQPRRLRGVSDAPQGGPRGPANFRFAQEERFILGEERTFLRPV